MTESCRTCMTRSENRRNLFGKDSHDILDKIAFCTGLQLMKDDNLPSAICSECFNHAEIAYKFKTKCLQADETFQKLLRGIKEEPLDTGFSDDLNCHNNDDLKSVTDLKFEEFNASEHQTDAENTKRMPPPTSRGHMLVDRVMSQEENHATPLPSNIEFEIEVMSDNAEDSRCSEEDNEQTESSARETQHINLKETDHIPENNNAEESEVNEGRPKKGRKRKYPNQNRNIRKRKTNMNEFYISAKGKKVSPRKFQGNLFKCNCPLRCTENLTVEQRENVFRRFWSAGTFEARCAILQASVKETQKKRSYSTTSKRQYTRTYYLVNTKICKKAFLNTLSISQSRIDSALQKYRFKTALTDRRGKKSGGKNAITPQQLEEMN